MDNGHMVLVHSPVHSLGLVPDSPSIKHAQGLHYYLRVVPRSEKRALKWSLFTGCLSHLKDDKSTISSASDNDHRMTRCNKCYQSLERLKRPPHRRRSPPPPPSPHQHPWSCGCQAHTHQHRAAPRRHWPSWCQARTHRHRAAHPHHR